MGLNYLAHMLLAPMPEGVYPLTLGSRVDKFGDIHRMNSVESVRTEF
jgi:hypothetical protein